MRAASIAVLLLLAGGIAWWFLQGREARVAEAPTAQAPAPSAAEAPAIASPRFDIVRVDRTGYAVVAGTGAPGARVELLANGEADAVVAVPAVAFATDTPLSAGPVELTLRQRPEGGTPITGEESVVVYVPEAPGDSPVVLRTTPGGATEILQRASDRTDGLGPLGIEAIDYDDDGNVIFSGRATPGSAVQLVLDGVPLGAPTEADEDGRWEMPAEVPPGRYTLRAVQLGPDGRPAYVVEVPFERARPDDVVRTRGGVIVQPGNSLWVISRAVYGEGRQYTIIYEANADQIRDPDLIYPGQVFRTPE